MVCNMTTALKAKPRTATQEARLALVLAEVEANRAACAAAEAAIVERDRLIRLLAKAPYSMSTREIGPLFGMTYQNVSLILRRKK